MLRIERAEESDNKWWYILMLVFSVVFYVGAFIGIVLLYVFFTEVSTQARQGGRQAAYNTHIVTHTY